MVSSHLSKNLTKVEEIMGKLDFALLESSDNLNAKFVTRAEWKSISDPIKQLPGPVIDSSCNSICNVCLTSLLKHKVPKNALARGLIGAVPEVLSSLSFAEKILIARVRTSRYVVRVSSGLYKMSGNAIAFSIPMPKVYKELPPPRDELDEVLAFIFTAPTQPVEAQLRKVPLLVSHRKVSNALEWLKLNHAEYKDLIVSQKNLLTYEDNKIPVGITYQKCQRLDGAEPNNGKAMKLCQTMTSLEVTVTTRRNGVCARINIRSTQESRTRSKLRYMGLPSTHIYTTRRKA